MATSKERTRERKVAEILCQGVYENAFGGKTRGRYLLSKKGLKKLLRVERLHSRTLRKLSDECQTLGHALIDLGQSIALADLRFIGNCRQAPLRIITRYK
jgi:hypothetical protein